jgi:transcriptional regulator with XRE-family HTH domain
MTYNELLKNVAKIIRFYRERKGYSRDKLGEAIGVSGDHIANYEYAKNLPRFHTMAKIVKVLEIPADLIFYGTTEEINKLAKKTKKK